MSTAVERLWIEPTLSRRINGPSARVPLDVYVALIDTPEVTAAAARFRRIRSYEIHALDDDHYWGTMAMEPGSLLRYSGASRDGAFSLPRGSRSVRCSARSAGARSACSISRLRRARSL